MIFGVFKVERRLAQAEAKVEELRRTVDGLVYDLAELQRRVRRVVWREAKAEERAEHADEGAPPNGTDPISAQLLARRRRGSPPPREGE